MILGALAIGTGSSSKNILNCNLVRLGIHGGIHEKASTPTLENILISPKILNPL